MLPKKISWRHEDTGADHCSHDESNAAEEPHLEPCCAG